MEEYPGVIGGIIGVLAFLGIWIYALSEWGFLLGLMFGWIPAIIGGIVAAYIWPLLAFLVLLIIIFSL